MLANNVFKSTKHVARNPRKVTKDDMREFFRRAIEGRLVLGLRKAPFRLFLFMFPVKCHEGGSNSF